MRWRALLLSGLFAASLGLGFTSSASADPPPWAGRWKHNKHYNGDSDHHWKHDRDWRRDNYWRNDHNWRNDRWRDDTSWRWRHDDDWRWRRDHDWWNRNDRYRGYPNSYGGYRYDRYDTARRNYNYNSSFCAQADARIARDQAKINEIGPSGRHRKALRWFHDDLSNAMRDRGRC